MKYAYIISDFDSIWDGAHTLEEAKTIARDRFHSLKGTDLERYVTIEKVTDKGRELVDNWL